MSQEDRNNFWDAETAADILKIVEYRKSLIQNRIEYRNKHFNFKKGDKMECLNIFKSIDNDEDIITKKPHLSVSKS